MSGQKKYKLKEKKLYQKDKECADLERENIVVRVGTYEIKDRENYKNVELYYIPPGIDIKIIRENETSIIATGNPKNIIKSRKIIEKLAGGEIIRI